MRQHQCRSTSLLFKLSFVLAVWHSDSFVWSVSALSLECRLQLARILMFEFCQFDRLVFSHSLLSLDLIEDFLAYQTEQATKNTQTRAANGEVCNRNSFVCNSVNLCSFRWFIHQKWNITTGLLYQSWLQLMVVKASPNTSWICSYGMLFLTNTYCTLNAWRVKVVAVKRQTGLRTTVNAIPI